MPVLFLSRERKQAVKLVCITAFFPAYDPVHQGNPTSFNLLDARGVISVTERQSYILRVRELAKSCGESLPQDQSRWPWLTRADRD